MEALLSPASLLSQVEALTAGQFLQDPLDLIEDGLSLLKAPERMSTVECAEKYRKLPGSEDGAVVGYDRWRTPYNVGPMDSLDSPRCNLMVMVKPSRSGGTTVVENYEFKMMRFGPMGHIAHVLNSDEAVTDYCRTVVKPMFELNPELQARVGRDRGDDTDTYKRVAGYPVEYLSAKDSTFRNRQPIFMVSDETDAWAKKYAKTPKVQIEGRQKQLGHRRKGAIMSHPDLGWNAGVAACYEDSTRGIYVMKCVECLGYAAAYATKFWPDVPQFRLSWTKSDSASNDERLELAERTACMVCPHCGAALSDEQRRQMVDEALRENQHGQGGWMHRGQTLDALQGIIGDMVEHSTHGYWIHGLMVKAETLSKLAREYEAALIKFERTKDAEQLKEFMSKALGEVFEGAASTGGVSAAGLKKRVKESPFERGMVPPGVKFITAAVDTGGRQFDVAWLGWDLDGRSWLLDRITLRQRLHDDGEYRDIRPAEQVADWLVLLDKVLDRRFPMATKPGWELPVAVACVDSGDGNVTWKARAFARMALIKGYAWGGWSKVKLIKGVGGKRPILPDAPRKIDRDERGRVAEPAIYEYSLGADKLKELTFERLSVTDDGPGQCYFAEGIEGHYIDQIFGEALVDGKWVRSGPNETLDLYGYAEAGRLMLRPDRADIDWTAGKLPPWARPVPPQGEVEAAQAPGSTTANPASPAKGKNIFERFDALNGRTTG